MPKAGEGVVSDNFNARYYSPSRGQFLSEDPVFLALGSPKASQLSGRSLPLLLANPQSLNSYSYANDNPITREDPSGDISTASLISQLTQIIAGLNNLLASIRGGSGGSSSGSTGSVSHVSGSSGSSASYGVGSQSSLYTTTAAYGYGGVVSGLNQNSFGDLPENTLICRGGACQADQFVRGAESVGPDGTLSGVSVRVGANGESAEELLQSLPRGFAGNGQLTTYGQLRSAGMTLEQQGADPLHGVIGGGTGEEMESLFNEGVGYVGEGVGFAEGL